MADSGGRHSIRQRGRHALPEGYPNPPRMRLFPKRRRQMGPGPHQAPASPATTETQDTGPSEARAHFGAFSLPLTTLTDVEVYLVAQTGETIDTLVMQSPHGRRWFTAYAVPRTAPGWAEALEETNTIQALRAGAQAFRARDGVFGRELDATLADGSHITFTTVSGDRWALRVVTRCSLDRAFLETQHTRAVLSQLVMDRGVNAWPAGEGLPLTIPDGWHHNA